MGSLSAERIREEVAANPKTRERDLATQLGISEAQLVAAYCGETVQRIDAHPDKVIAAAQSLGEVMALTRNESCVHEKTGLYEQYHSGPHASMVLGEQIDLRIFPSQWQHGFLVEKNSNGILRRSIQIFDAAGDAVHKIYLRDGSTEGAWEKLVETLPLDDQSQEVAVTERKPTEVPKADASKVDVLRKEWKRMTDTHQFMRLTSKLKMNRLGAYRIVGQPFVRKLAIEAVDLALQASAGVGTELMIFVGNKGCIQIHSGPIETLRAMGPWQNVMDPLFNLHLRLDHIAEVYAVEKPTQRGPAVSVEAFDADGAIILQIFAVGKEGRDSRPEWRAIVDQLPDLSIKETA